MSKSQPESAIAESASPLDRYQALRDYMLVMRRYAEAKDWERLVEIQTTFVQIAAEIADADPAVILSPEQAERKFKLVTEIREAEAVVRARLRERLNALSAEIDETRRGSRASRAYRESDKL